MSNLPDNFNDLAKENFRNAIKYLGDSEKINELKELVINNPIILTIKHPKNDFCLFQIACILDNIDFIKFVNCKTKEFLKIIDREISFLILFSNFLKFYLRKYSYSFSCIR